MRRLLPRLCLIVSVLLALPAQAFAAAAAQRCFASENPAITNCIDEPFASFWQNNGGLALFGYPLTKATTTNAGQVQWFERARLERPRQQSRVQAAALGEQLLGAQGRAASPAKPQAGCAFFAQTQHNVCAPFLAFYRSRGGTAKPIVSGAVQALFGQPLTEATTERAADGQEYMTQWFQRARFELHPENPPATRVLLGQIGAEALALQQQAAAPAAPARPTCDTVPPANNAILMTTTCLEDANRDQLFFSLKGYEAGERLGAWLVDPDGLTVGPQIGRQSRAVCSLGGDTMTLGALARCRNWVIDDYGNASGVVLDGAALYAGKWMLVLQSKHSDRSTQIFFQVLPHGFGRPDPCAGAPDPTNAIIAPACGLRGQLYKLVARGFSPGQRVSAFLTGPDTIVEPLSAQYYQPSSADANGNVTIVGLYPDNVLKGDYYITVANDDGKYQAVAPLRVPR